MVEVGNFFSAKNRYNIKNYLSGFNQGKFLVGKNVMFLGEKMRPVISRFKQSNTRVIASF